MCLNDRNEGAKRKSFPVRGREGTVRCWLAEKQERTSKHGVMLSEFGPWRTFGEMTLSFARRFV